jgi:transposase InsO family protein
MQVERVGNLLERIAMDILGPLPETPRGNKYILVLGDYFTKWTEAYAIQNMEAATVARMFVNEFVARFGAPDSLHTDQGRNFDSTLLKEVCRLLGVENIRTTPYHPQSDGLVERFNRTLLNMLSIIATEKENDWDLQLPTAMFAYRTSVHETTTATSFSLMFGHEARLPVDVMYGSPPEET